MHVEGITWHAVTLEKEQFAAMRKLSVEVLGLTPLVEQEGWTLFPMPNGTILDLFVPDAVPAYGYNNGIVFGFRVDDIEAASAEIAAAGCELLCDITPVKELGTYAYRHFRGPDGRVYGLNEQR